MSVPPKLTMWQKIKSLSTLLAAITALLTAMGGTFAAIKNQNKQDKIQESVYNTLTKRFEEFAVDIAVLQTELKYMRVHNDQLQEDLKHMYGNRMKSRPKAIKREDIEERIIKEASSTIVAEINTEDLPAEIEYKGVAKLPEFDNIQQVVTDKGKAIQKYEIKKK